MRTCFRLNLTKETICFVAFVFFHFFFFFHLISMSTLSFLCRFNGQFLLSFAQSQACCFMVGFVFGWCFALTFCRHGDKHLNKMQLESAQLGCTVYHLLNEASPIPNFDADVRPNIYKKAHSHHPVVKWAMKARPNFLSVVELGIELGEEKKRRIERMVNLEKGLQRSWSAEHKSQAVLQWLKVRSFGLDFFCCAIVTKDFRAILLLSTRFRNATDGAILQSPCPNTIMWTKTVRRLMCARPTSSIMQAQK
jgi:hypothetical protein